MDKRRIAQTRTAVTTTAAMMAMMAMTTVAAATQKKGMNTVTAVPDAPLQQSTVHQGASPAPAPAPALHGDYLICYDIACPRRLGRIHRCLKRQAMAVQYSVFLFTGSPQQLERCLAELERLMDKRQDDIRAYPLPRRGLRLHQGRALLPEGIYWSGLPAAWQQPA